MSNRRREMRKIGLIAAATLLAVVGMAGAASAQCDAILSDGLGPSGNTYQVGDVINYYVTLSCPVGSCELTVDQIDFFPPPGSDDACDDVPIFSITPGTTLIPGAAPVIWTVAEWPDLAYTVQPGDAGSTMYANICTKFSWTSAGVPLDDEDTATSINFVDCPEPCIEVHKSVDCDISKVGDMVTYTICVENCGTYFDLTDVMVWDTLLGSTYGSPLAGFPSTLAPGESYCLDFEYEVQPGDDTGEDYPDAYIMNQADAAGTDACDGETQVTDMSEVVWVYLVHPDISVTKTCNEPEPVAPGDPAEFEIVISNTGDIPLDITTDEPEILPFTLDEFSDATFYVERDCGSEPEVHNDITVTATIPPEFCELPNIYTDEDGDECPCGECSLDCSKTVEPDVSKAGHDVYFEVCVENTGTNCDLELVSVTDDIMGDLSSYFSSILSDGGIECYGYTYTIPEGTPSPLVNTVTFTYLGADGETYVCTDVAEVTILHPEYTVDVTCTTDPVPEGGDGEFEVYIVNTGDVDLIITTDYVGNAGPFTLPVGSNSHFYVTAPCEGSEACFGINVHAELPSMYGLDNYYDEYAEDCCPCPGLEGCTPGYWGHGGADCWCDDYEHGDLVSDVFDVPSQLSALGAETLLEAVTTPGGGGSVAGRANQLIFHGVAALLNACNDDVAYPMGVGAVIDFVNEALATLDAGEIGAAKSTLDMYNNYGCSIDAHCNPIEDEPDPDKGLLEDHTGELTNPAEFRSGVIPAEAWSQPLPNPFTGATTINFGLPKSGAVSIDVYDVAGRHVATVVDGEKGPGSHEAVWNGKNSHGTPVPAGVYFYRFAFDNETLMKKMIVMK
jgi:uncharacterized repeat protein (TIGR01451 family)